MHDLVEDLPVNWNRDQGGRRENGRRFAELDAAKRQLAASENCR
ncbi:hypothetical protein ACFSQQ_00240 [Mesorhizobium kowhaii]